MRALLFSGQGSQYVGMMKDLADNFSSINEKLDLANEILDYDIKSIMFDGPSDKLKETRYTQPALFLHSAILFDHLKSKLDFGATAGHSVGEYAALYAAGVMSFKDALSLVALRGELMFIAGENQPGTMFAVIGLDDDGVIEVCNNNNFPEEDKYIVAANFNSPGQVVVSGSRDWLRESAPKFKDAGAKLVKELQVSGAFHSPLMEAAKEKLADMIGEIEFTTAAVPVYTNVNAKAEKDPLRLKELLIEQLTSPVKWTQTLKSLHEDTFDSYTEIGAGKVLQGLVKRTIKDVEISGYDKLEDL